MAEPALLAEALAVAVMIDFLLGRGMDEARLARALSLEDPEHRVDVAFRPSLIAGFLAFYGGDFDRARRFLYPLRARLYEHGKEADATFLVATMGWIECWAGDLLQARRFVDEALEAATLTESETMMAASVAFGALVDAYAGKLERCREQIENALELAARSGYDLAAMWASAARAVLELSLGNASGAHDALRPWAEFVEKHGIADPITAFYLPDEIEALIALDELDRAEPLTDALAARGRDLDRPWALATSGRCRALLSAARGDLEMALVELDRALAEHERLAMPLELGRTLLMKGQIERRTRRKAAAKASFERALALFEQMGASLWAEKTRSELARVGLRPAAPTELTETERRVAELAASGLTNREVAAQLYMSAKTVEAHLRSAYRKLGIRSRAELGARLAGARREPAQT
ncbi:MAG TPA: LuxR C-terminal-related transcriptional regulator [Gaiellaceae bacterium]|nr:LuxR C-terminal-related transcriptional regulator [Gaiellaceae bacterium]